MDGPETGDIENQTPGLTPKLQEQFEAEQELDTAEKAVDAAQKAVEAGLAAAHRAEKAWEQTEQTFLKAPNDNDQEVRAHSDAAYASNVKADEAAEDIKTAADEAAAMLQAGRTKEALAAADRAKEAADRAKRAETNAENAAKSANDALQRALKEAQGNQGSAGKEQPKDKEPPAVAEAEAGKGKAKKVEIGQAVPVEAKEKRKLSDKDRYRLTKNFLTKKLGGADAAEKWFAKTFQGVDFGNAKEVTAAVKEKQKVLFDDVKEHDGILGKRAYKAIEDARGAEVPRKPAEPEKQPEAEPKMENIDPDSILFVSKKAPWGNQIGNVVYAYSGAVEYAAPQGNSWVEDANGVRHVVLTKYLQSYADDPAQQEAMKQQYIASRENAFRVAHAAWTKRMGPSTSA